MDIKQVFGKYKRNAETVGRAHAATMDSIIHEMANIEPGESFVFITMKRDGTSRAIGGLSLMDCLNLAHMLLEASAAIADVPDGPTDEKLN